MHELSLAQNLVEQLESAATAEGALRITRVVVVIGKYSGVEPEAFRFAFPFAAKETLAENAQLDIEELPVTVKCNLCGNLSTPNPTLLLCDTCESNQVELTGGREFTIKTVELEVP